MSSVINVNTDTVSKAKSRIESLRGEYEDNYKKVYELDKQINESYKGVDSDKFSERVAGFENDFIDLNEKFKEYITFLGNVIQKYETAQTELTNKASRLAADR